MKLIRTGDSFSMIADPVYKSTKPTISWTKSVGATSYRLTISSTDASCSNPLQSYPAISDLSQTLSTLANGSYFACLEATRGVKYFSATNSGLSFEVKAPVAVISNAPSGYNAATKLDVTISGGDFYKYKLVPTSTGCKEETGYSAERAASTKITDNIAMKDTYAYSLCVVAKDSEGNWQDYAFASKASWNLFRLNFSGDSLPTTSIATRLFKNTNGNSSTWTLTGLCDAALGNVTISGAGLNAATSATCSSSGTFSKDIYWAGATAPYLENYNGTILYGSKIITISQFGVTPISTKLYQAATNHNLILVPDLATLTSLLWNATDIGVNDYLVQTADITFDTAMTTTPGNLYGVYEGNGFALTNFSNSIARSFFTSVGAVGTASNMNLVNATVTGSTGSKGVLTGSIPAGSVIHDLKISGSITITGSAQVSGVVGGGAGLILRVASSVNVTSRFQTIGGIAALLTVGGVIDQAFNAGSITGNALTSGNVGGIVGINGGTIKNSYSSGGISHTLAAPNIGGLVGTNSGSGAVSLSYTSSPISMPASTVGVDYVVGVNAGTVDNSSVFFNSEVSCTFNAGTACPGTTGGTGKTSIQLTKPATYTGFDFTPIPIWKISENQSNATFGWQ